VTLRATLNLPIRGVYDLVELLLAATFFVALPAVFLRDENIVVNSIDDIAPRWVPYLKRFAELLAVAILAVLAWQGCGYLLAGSLALVLLVRRAAVEDRLTATSG